jgi:transposase
LSARAIQCAGKQASAIVRGTKQKHEQRLFVYNQLIKENKLKQANKLLKTINNNKINIPIIKTICPELDSRFVNIDFNNSTTFDGWLTLTSLGNKLKISIPIKKSDHFNKLLNIGKIKPGIRLSLKDITFMFDLPDLPKKESGTTIGIDIGQLTAISCSNGFTSSKCKHGWDLDSICHKISKKKKGTKAFKRAVQHRKNYINWTINQLDFTDVKECKFEEIKDLRRGKRNSRKLGHWTYTDIFAKLESKCEECRVVPTRVNPTYTSKRCSECGWTRQRNRKRKYFKCGKCGYTADSDLNASRNIALDLKPIWFKKRHQHDIKTGFYWHVDGQEHVVPVVFK